MLEISNQLCIPDEEIEMISIRAQGAGGQNVNKVNSKIELRFNIDASALLSEEEKIRIREKLKNRINNDGELVIVSQSERSQLQNREKALERFYVLIEKALRPEKPRKETKPTIESRLKRLEEKRFRSEKKANRKPPEI